MVLAAHPLSDNGKLPSASSPHLRGVTTVMARELTHSGECRNVYRAAPGEWWVSLIVNRTAFVSTSPPVLVVKV